MHKATTLLALAGLLFALAGCGSGDTERPSQPTQQPPAAPAQASGEQQPAAPQQQPPAKDGKQWYDYGPGDPRGDIKALQKAKDTAKKIEESRQAPPDDDQ